jgi:pyruvate formate lyase activating enzyme
MAVSMLSRPLSGARLQCRACAHACVLPPGATGRCGVRRHRDGRLELSVYGYLSAVHVDPVEKKPLYHFCPGRAILSVGTVGCNLRCAWCQNWSLSQQHAPSGPGRRLSPRQLVDFCRGEGLDLLAFTYNEPGVLLEYARDTALLAAEAGVRCALVTNGFFTPEALAALTPGLAAANVDLKAWRDETYRHFCGGRLKPVLRTIERLAATASVWLEVTTLLVPGVNDSDEELGAIARWLAALSPDLPWHVSGFHPDYQMLDRSPTSVEALRRAWRLGREAGLRFVYTGNVWDPGPGSDTACPGCGAVVLERRLYELSAAWHEPGVCHQCGQRLAGVWT